MALEEEILPLQIIFQHPTVVGMVAVDLVDLVVGAEMDLTLLMQLLYQPLLYQPLGILFLVEGALYVTIHLTLQMPVPIVESDVSMMLSSYVGGKLGGAFRAFILHVLKALIY